MDAGTRKVVVTLVAQRAGSYRLRVLLFPDASLRKENRIAEVLREATLPVSESGASSARSFLASFWPPQGPVAGVAAGFVIQVIAVSNSKGTRFGPCNGLCCRSRVCTYQTSEHNVHCKPYQRRMAQLW